MFRIVQKYLRITSTAFFTHPLDDERILKVVIKGLLPDTSEEELASELKSLGYEVKNVRQFSNSIRKFPIYLVSLVLSPSNKRIFDETSLLYMSIKVESYRSNSPAQCFSCQRFGHSSLHCGYAPRCVKCAGPHLAKECSKTKEAAPKCVNCEGDHTANYSKCPALLLEKNSRRPVRPNSFAVPTKSDSHTVPLSQLSNPSPSSAIPNQPSYASVATSNSSSKTDSKTLSDQISTIIPLLQSGKMDIKDALILVLTLLPLLINQQ